MKKFLIVPALLLAGNAVAQKGLHVGVRIQPQSTWLYNQDDSDEGPELDFKSSFGMAAGLEVGYHFTDGLGLGVGFLYSSHNQKYTGKHESGGVSLSTMEAHTRLNYFKIPVTLQVNTSSDAPAMFSFFIGPQFNFLMGYSDKQVVTPRVGSATTTELKGTEAVVSTAGSSSTTKAGLDVSAYNKSQIGAVMGFGAQFKLADNLFLGLEFRFDYLFGDVENKKAKVTSINGTNLGSLSYEMWKGLDSKYEGSSNANRTRATTTAFTGGFGLTFKYVLPTD